MTNLVTKLAIAVVAGGALALSAAAPAQAVKKGGILKFVVPAEPPSFDGHRETTFALIHPIAPFYSVLIRVNPDDPASPTDFVCDLCTAMPKPTDKGTTYTFDIRKGVKFSDGSALTAHDVVATYQKIIFPAEGVASARKAFFISVDSVTAPDDHTVVFKLKFPSGAFIPALANPYNFVYAKAILDKFGRRAPINNRPPKFRQYVKRLQFSTSPCVSLSGIPAAAWWVSGNGAHQTVADVGDWMAAGTLPRWDMNFVKTWVIPKGDHEPGSKGSFTAN